jgi:hypothetical protein
LVPIVLAVLFAAAATPAQQSLFSTPVFTQVDAGVPFQTSMPRSAIVADFNADGLPDVVIAEDAGLRCVFGDGAGGFTGWAFTPVNFAGFTSVEIAGAPDLNLDGFPDLVTASSAMNVRVHMNDGACSFPVSTPVPATSLPNTCCAGNLVFEDIDGFPPVELIRKDYIAYPTYIQEMVRVYSFNPATNAFQYSQAFNLPVGESCGWVTCGDYNGDLLPDIAYLAYTGVYPQPPLVSLRALVNLGSGQFQAAAGSPWSVPASTGCGTCSFTNPCAPFLGPMTAADVTGDGIDDLVAFGATHWTLTGCYSIWIFTGDPIALFLPPSFGRGMGPGNFPVGQFSFADVDDDRNIDIVWGLLTARVTPVFGFDGTAPINMPFTYAYCTGSLAEAIGDMNLDGAPDVVFARPFVPVGNTCPTYVGTALNQSRRKPGCGTSTKFLVGTPNPGNAFYSFTLSSGIPSTSAVLGVSLAEANTPIPGCLIGLDLSPTNLVLPSSSGLGITTANALGTATIGIGIPNAPGFVGFQFYAQWIFGDPAGPITLGGTTWSTSISRRVLIW